VFLGALREGNWRGPCFLQAFAGELHTDKDASTAGKIVFIIVHSMKLK
jgi:hypothetical protein